MSKVYHSDENEMGFFTAVFVLTLLALRPSNLLAAVRYAGGVALIAIPLHFFVAEGFQFRDATWTFWGYFFVWIFFRKPALSAKQKAALDIIAQDTAKLPVTVFKGKK